MMASSPLYLDTSQLIDKHVHDLLTHITLEENLNQMTNHAAGITRRRETRTRTFWQNADVSCFRPLY